jgi:hypothetical protein
MEDGEWGIGHGKNPIRLGLTQTLRNLGVLAVQKIKLFGNSCVSPVDIERASKIERL